jgi:hypothetical protein
MPQRTAGYGTAIVDRRPVADTWRPRSSGRRKGYLGFQKRPTPDGPGRNKEHIAGHTHSATLKSLTVCGRLAALGH